ncbi:MAG TPA: hypothetical protein VFQ54_10375, partial [Thermomicrobiales bacterium]|nr:hypothetical protein [Thermomicrobiales bacterium]
VGTPATTGVDDVIVTLLGFRNEADARDAFKLTSGTLVAGAILGESDQPLTSTPVKGLGDDATLYLGGKTYLGGDERAEGLLLVRSGALGIVASGEGRNASQLSDMLRSFAAFIVDQKPSSTPVTVLGTGRATGGPFDLMPGPGDTSVLAGLVPVDDYDLLVNDSPIKPAATPSGQAPSPGGLRIRVAGTGASVR